MNVITGIIRWVELNDPVYRWDIETSGGNVCAKKDTRRSVDEFKEGVGALLLFLFALSSSPSD